MAIPSLELNSGFWIPVLGLGTFKMPPSVTAGLVEEALRMGYRHIDTAAIYGNEAEVGQAIKRSGIPREELFITTKLWNDQQGLSKAKDAFEISIDKLGLEYVDLYLIHWPTPAQGKAVESWEALIQINETGRSKSIGVSNFRPEDLAAVIDATGRVPAVNQIEMHPLFQQRSLRALHAELGIVTEAWSPLGQGADLNQESVQAVAAETGKSPAQVVIRWMIQLGVVLFPKTARPERLAENMNVFDFELTPEQMQRLDAIPDAARRGGDPAVFS
ncbi:MAG: aldo/keto reductase [Bifidobacteriaceae bacterium]|jgi:2,5-diketo-D-gluconate reductase A|nr:aldo/keto reductase [Bifidobacteriaceae bacterium]